MRYSFEFSNILLFIILHLFICTKSVAQLYTTAGGLRMGTDWGLTVQQRIAKKTTLEMILQSSLQREEVIITTLVEQHYPIVTKGLNIYIGGGLHKGWNTNNNQEDSFENPFGMTLIAGAELTLGRLNLSYDFKPAINIKGGQNGFYTQTGISLRYIFVKNKVWKKMQKRKKKKRKTKEKAKRDHPAWQFWKN